MIRFTLWRLLQFVPVVFLTSIIVWGMIYLLPGDPATALAGERATPAQIEATRERLGLDRPIYIQYLTWVGNLMTGNLGVSLQSGSSIADLITPAIQATLQLALFVTLLGIPISLVLGIVMALWPNSILVKPIFLYQNLGLAAPTFWVAILLILWLSVSMGAFPAVSDFVPFWEDPMKAIRMTFLPALTLAISISAIIARFVAASVIETMPKPFVRAARARGVPEHVVLAKHIVPNALLPVVTVVGLQIGGFIGGSVVTETIFNYPGIGRLVYRSIANRDFALAQSSILLVIVLFLLTNLAADILSAKLDPRVRNALTER